MPETKAKHYIESIYYDIELTARVMKMLGAQIFEQLHVDISPDEHAALDTISCFPEVCQRDLAKLILKDRANTGRILNLLEQKQLITRFIDVKNNRLIKKMAITEKGNQKLCEINHKIKVILQQFSSKFPQNEIDNLQLALRHLRKKLEEAVEMNI